MNKIYKPTIFRIITNATINCIFIVLMLLIGLEFFMPFEEQYMMIVSIMFEIMFLVAIVLFTYTEHKYTSLELTKEGVNQLVVSSKKKSMFIPYSDIKNVTLEKFAVKIIYGDNKKLVLDYYKETKEIAERIQREMNKQSSNK